MFDQRECRYHVPPMGEENEYLEFYACDFIPKNDPVIRRVSVSWNHRSSVIQSMFIIYRPGNRQVSAVDIEWLIGGENQKSDLPSLARWRWVSGMEVYAEKRPPFELRYVYIGVEGAQWLLQERESALISMLMSPGI